MTCSCPDSVCLVKGLHIGNFLFNQNVVPTRPACPAILMLGLPGSYVILVSCDNSVVMHRFIQDCTAGRGRGGGG